jgi:hypothetical protein
MSHPIVRNAIYAIQNGLGRSLSKSESGAYGYLVRFVNQVRNGELVIMPVSRHAEGRVAPDDVAEAVSRAGYAVRQFRGQHYMGLNSMYVLGRMIEEVPGFRIKAKGNFKNQIESLAMSLNMGYLYDNGEFTNFTRLDSVYSGVAA